MPTTSTPRHLPGTRGATRAEITRGTFDLLVIGGGILGTSVAWMATQAGLRVAMVDAGDFAGATSSASSKLVHGGLRYLQTGNVRLVAENHRERRALSGDVAPHLVTPMPFLVPVYKGGPHSAAKMAAGAFLYSALSAFGDGVGRVMSPAQARRLAPALRTDGLKAVAAYHDHQMNDSRMAIMTVRAAAEAGAVVLNHARVVGLRTTHGRVTGADLRDGVDGTEFGVDARLVLNATGPWVDHLRRMEDPAAAPSVRLSKGAHLVLRTDRPWRAVLTIPVDKYRVSFAIPWEDHLLLGTTDESYAGDPADVGVVAADTDQILGEAAAAVEADTLDPDRITYSFAGLRVLPGGPGSTSSAKRETVVTLGRGGMLSVAGGKWTTYRHIGRTVIERLRRVRAVPLAEDMSPTLKTVPLPGIGRPEAVAHRLMADREPPARMDPLVARHLATHYGSVSLDIADLVRADPALGERIHPGGPDIWAQAVFARNNEWAVTVDDVLRRRTTVTVRGLDDAAVRDRVAALLAAAPA
ncbi:FAD-dependent oxidoreductase [Nocardiopsis mangrovi]|uniref:FAD-dependent oxidoreductase n=1 Tax=Nocardiopsis mangrovi TaxID=1179818 RepID=A0ABV9E3T7_9ACTN